MSYQDFIKQWNTADSDKRKEMIEEALLNTQKVEETELKFRAKCQANGNLKMEIQKLNNEVSRLNTELEEYRKYSKLVDYMKKSKRKGRDSLDEKILELYKKPMNPYNIAKELNISYSTVRLRIQKMRLNTKVGKLN